MATVQFTASIYRTCQESACVAQAVIIFTPSELTTSQQGFKSQIQGFFLLKENSLFCPCLSSQKRNCKSAYKRHFQGKNCGTFQNRHLTHSFAPSSSIITFSSGFGSIHVQYSVSSGLSTDAGRYHAVLCSPSCDNGAQYSGKGTTC